MRLGRRMNDDEYKWGKAPLCVVHVSKERCLRISAQYLHHVWAVASSLFLFAYVCPASHSIHWRPKLELNTGGQLSGIRKWSQLETLSIDAIVSKPKINYCKFQSSKNWESPLFEIKNVMVTFEEGGTKPFQWKSLNKNGPWRIIVKENISCSKQIFHLVHNRLLQHFSVYTFFDWCTLNNFEKKSVFALFRMAVGGIR